MSGLLFEVRAQWVNDGARYPFEYEFSGKQDTVRVNGFLYQTDVASELIRNIPKGAGTDGWNFAVSLYGSEILTIAKGQYEIFAIVFKPGRIVAGVYIKESWLVFGSGSGLLAMSEDGPFHAAAIARRRIERSDTKKD